MKIVQKFMMLAVLFGVYQQSYARQGDQADGGECCYRMPSSMACGFDLQQVDMDDAFDLSARSGDNPAASGSDNSEDLEPAVWCSDMNFAEVRKFFPIFNTMVKDCPFVYFDSASTAQMPQMVIDAIVEYYETYKSNVGRGLYAFAERSTHMFELARAKVARFISAHKQEVVFTSGATASINLVAHMWAQHHINKDDEIVLSDVEHNANFIPWQQLSQKKGAVLKIVPVNQHGVIDIDVLKTYLSEKTKLVAITHQSNILGTINDIAAIVQAAHAVGAKVLVDAAQSIAHQRIDVAQIGCDFLAFSGHKLFGPTGVGVLFISERLFGQCVLENFGGGMVYSVTPEHTEFKCMPHCLEPGTQPIAQVIGLGAAIDFVQQYINFDQAQHHETALARKLAYALQQIPGITLISPIPDKHHHNNMVTFSSDKYHAYDIASYLNQYGIAVRAGYHCVQPYHDKLGGSSSVRMSFTIYNTHEEVDFLIDCLNQFFMGTEN